MRSNTHRKAVSNEVRKAHIETLGKYGFVITEDDVRQHAGSRTADVVSRWHEQFAWEEPSKEEMTQQIVNNVMELVHINGEALPGVYEVIRILEENTIPMAIASSSGIDLIQVVMKRLSLDRHIKYVCSGEHEKRGKPFPDVFLSTAKKMGVRPGDCVVFEDSLNGVKAAKAAGMKCIAVPEHPHDPGKFQMADMIVKSLEDVTWDTIAAL